MNTKSMIREVKFGIYKVRFLKAFLGASIVYLVTYLIMMLFNLPTYGISSIIAILFFISELVVESKKSPLTTVEEKYDDLNEELRTVSDTLEKKNELVEDLRHEVRKKLTKHVDFGDFVGIRKMLSRVLTIFFLSFLIILIASLNIQLLDAQKISYFSRNVYDKLKSEAEKYTVVNGENQVKMNIKKLAFTAGIGGGDTEGGEIFGDSAIVELGDEKINIEIRPTEFEVSVDDFESPEKKNFLEKPYEDDVFVDKAYGYEESIPEKRQEIVKRYFKSLAEG